MGNTKKQEAHEQQIKSAIVDGHRRGVCDKNGNTIPRIRVDGGRRVAAFHAFRESGYWTRKESKDDNEHNKLLGCAGN
jgi:hypothetical protein